MFIPSRKYDYRNKEGYWIFPYSHHGYKKCSVCKEIGFHMIYPYCPTCGAKMQMENRGKKYGK